jgi:hypothetical protein
LKYETGILNLSFFVLCSQFMFTFFHIINKYTWNTLFAHFVLFMLFYLCVIGIMLKL